MLAGIPAAADDDDGSPDLLLCLPGKTSCFSVTIPYWVNWKRWSDREENITVYFSFTQEKLQNLQNFQPELSGFQLQQPDRMD